MPEAPHPPGYPHVKVIAHRGNSSQAPENTLASFLQAIDLNVDFLECDVQLSNDAVPVVLHDGTIHRIFSACTVCDVNALSWPELKMLDAGSWFDKKYSDQRVLSLEEFLMIPKGRIGCMIEIKEETFHEWGLARLVGDVLKKVMPLLPGHGPILIGSMSPEVLLCIHSYLPGQSLISVVREIEQLKEFETIQSRHYALRYNIATREVISELRSRGAEVWAWTVDDKDTAKQLIDDGIQGIITNQPKKIQQMHIVPQMFT